MAPNTQGEEKVAPTGCLFEDDPEVDPEVDPVKSSQKTRPTARPSMVIVWRNVILMGALHAIFPYGVYLLVTESQRSTVVFTVLLYYLSGLGITAGAHRLWTHRAYKARLPLRIFLAFCNTLAFQNDIFEWSRDHRVHHKYSETDADPHNARRGFFFSHVGWLLVRKHPEVLRKGKAIDVSDIIDDPVVKFQRKYYKLLVLTVCFVMPTVVPWAFWGESLWNAYFVCAMARYCFGLNCTWLVNSAAHLWGNKPYDRFINPVENLGVSSLALGEGFHNYHHTFPWDYKTAELGKYSINITTLFIDFMAWLGQVYDRKTVQPSVVLARIKRTGDGTHPLAEPAETPPEGGRVSSSLAEDAQDGGRVSSSLAENAANGSLISSSLTEKLPSVSLFSSSPVEKEHHL